MKISNEKVAIVTGGTGALGRIIVNKLSDEGMKVYVPARTLEEFNIVFDSSTKSEGDEFKLKKIFAFNCDATDESSVSEFVSKVADYEHGNIHYLVNTVGGIGAPATVEELSFQDHEKLMKLNFNSTFYFTRDVLKYMKNNNYGRIVSIAAIAGTEPSPKRFSYSFAKAGVINLMDTVSEEMKNLNIRCNTIIPGIMDTPANREWGSADDIKKWVKPEDIAEIIYNFLSTEFSSVRSSHIKVYGAY